MKAATPRIRLLSPLAYQEEILFSDARFKALVIGRRAGKTTLSGIMAIDGHGPTDGHFPGLVHGAKIWFVAPTYKLAGKFWREAKDALKGAWVEKDEVERRIVIPGGGELTVWSGDDPDSVRGDGPDGVIVDEAARCHQDLWRSSLRPALTDRSGWAVFASTPKGANWFKGLFDAVPDRPGWARWQLPSSVNPIITTAELEETRLDMPPLLFAQEHLAEFITAGLGLFKPEWFSRYDSTPEGYRIGPAFVGLGQMLRFATVDLAASIKTTADYTVIASWGAWNGNLILLDVLRVRMEGPDIVPAIRRACERWRLSSVWIEKVGFQLALVQQARREGLPVRELVPDRDKIARFLPVTALGQGGRLWLPTYASWLPAFEFEIASFPEGPHDDQADALAYGAEVLRHLRRPEAAVEAAPRAPSPFAANAPAGCVDGFR